MSAAQSSIWLCAVAVLGAAASFGMPGGWSVVNSDTVEAIEITNFVQTTINARTNSMYVSKVTAVEKLERQVVAGFNYKMVFDFSRTTCTKGSNMDLDACNEISKVESCTASVFKSLQQTLELNTFSCSPKTAKRVACGGCIVDATGNFDAIAQFALSSLNAAENSDRKLVGVTNARTQVVAGTLYYLTLSVRNGDQQEECVVKVWERLWLNDRQLTESKCTPKESKRQLAGGVASQNDPSSFTDVAKFAVDALSAGENSVSQLLQVTDVKTQVVAGVLYYMTVRISTQGQGERICKVKVWERVWLPEESDRRQLTSSDCSAATAKRAMAGGLKEEAEPETFRDLAKFGVDAVNAQSNGALAIGKVLRARTQVVAGTMYYLTVEVTDGSTTKVCDVNVWERLWLAQPRQLTSTTC